MNSFATLIQQFKSSVIEGLEPALKCLEQLLSPQSDNYNDLILLKGRYGALQRDLLLGLIAPEAYDLQRNALSHALLVLADLLQSNDLKPELLGQSPAAADAKRGEILYHIPTRMQLQRESKCVVRVAWALEQLYEGWQSQPGEVQRDIRIAEIMGVELINVAEEQPFAIRTLSEPVQFLDCNECTEWIFYVKPKVTGEFPLALRVSVIEVIRDREYKKDIVLEERIRVATEADEPEPGESFQKADAPVVFGEVPALGTAEMLTAAPPPQPVRSPAASSSSQSRGPAAALPSAPAPPMVQPAQAPPTVQPAPAAPGRPSFSVRNLAPLALIFVTLGGALWAGLFGFGSNSPNVSVSVNTETPAAPVDSSAIRHTAPEMQPTPEEYQPVALEQPPEHMLAPEETPLPVGIAEVQKQEQTGAKTHSADDPPAKKDNRRALNLAVIELAGAPSLALHFVYALPDGAVLQLIHQPVFKEAQPVILTLTDGTVLRSTIGGITAQAAYCTWSTVQIKALATHHIARIQIGKPSEGQWTFTADAAEQLKQQSLLMGL